MSWSDDMDASDDRKLALPFSVDLLRVLDGSVHEGFAWIRESETNALKRGQYKIDVDILRSDGAVCVQLRGLVSREPTVSSVAQEPGVLHHLVPVWRPIERTETGAHASQPESCLVVTAPNDDTEWLPPAYLACSNLEIGEADDETTIANRMARLGTFDHFVVWRLPPFKRRLSVGRTRRPSEAIGPCLFSCSSKRS